MVESTPNLTPLDVTSPDIRPHGGCSGCGSGSAADGLARCGNGLEKIYPTTAVRFGFMRYIGEFTHTPELRFTCGAKVVVQTQRGIELGEQVSLTCTGCDKSITREQMKDWVKSSGEDTYMFNAGRILREATSADLAEFARIQAGCRPKRDLAKRIAHQHKLNLNVVECECPLGGERIIFYFTAAERIDFRAMVKDLAKEYRTRIEMRQIGARDEARLLADFETCGREVCCKVFLKTLKPISMRMAKLQKATLDPSQVSGRCGRLKCCLRYEHTGYEELDKRLPRMGTRIQTNHGDGVVVNRQVLTQLVQIRKDDDTLLTVVVEDILTGGKPRSPQASTPADQRADGSSVRRSSKTASPAPSKRESRRPDPREPRRGASKGEEPPPRSAESQEPAQGNHPPPAPGPGRGRPRPRRRRKRNGGNSGRSGGDSPSAPR